MRKVDYTVLYHPELNTWIKEEGNAFKIGITDWAQKVIGTISNLHDLPEVGHYIIQNMQLCEVESNKATTEILSPLGGEIIDINSNVMDDPSLLNLDPYRRGWILKLKPNDLSQLDDLLSPQEYEEAIDSFFRKST